VGGSAGTTYVVTCGLCGQSWQMARASDHEIRECLFCGMRGALRPGPRQTQAGGEQWIEAWLDPVGR
jgi:hypothetical protein